MKKIAESLQQAVFGINLAMDVWSEPAFKHSHLGIYAHYIDAALKLHAEFLGLRTLEQRHTGIYLKQEAKILLAEYGVDDRNIHRYITDNASNFSAGFKKERISKNTQ